MSNRERDHHRVPGAAALIASLFAVSPPAAAAEQTIVEWLRDPVRIRTAPTAPSSQRPKRDLPQQPVILNRTPEGLLVFRDLDGRELFVSQGDVKTSRGAEPSPPPPRPQSGRVITGSQGFGGR